MQQSLRHVGRWWDEGTEVTDMAVVVVVVVVIGASCRG